MTNGDPVHACVAVADPVVSASPDPASLTASAFAQAGAAAQASARRHADASVQTGIVDASTSHDVSHSDDTSVLASAGANVQHAVD